MTNHDAKDDRMGHYLLLEGRARCAIVNVTQTVADLQSAHGLDPLTTIALGRAIGCVALLGSRLKMPAQYIQCSFKNEHGLLKNVVVECNGNGHLRGYVRVPRIADELGPDEDIPQSVREAMGDEGQLIVTEGQRGEKSPHTAISAFQDGGIASDIARYLTESEQLPSAVAAGVKLDRDGNVLGAGAAVVQKMGGQELSEKELSRFEEIMAKELNVSDRIASGESLDQICKVISGNDSFQLLDSRPLAMKCSCSHDRIAVTLMSLGKKDLDSLKDIDGGIQTRCQFCGSEYAFDASTFQKH